MLEAHIHVMLICLKMTALKVIRQMRSCHHTCLFFFGEWRSVSLAAAAVAHCTPAGCARQTEGDNLSRVGRTGDLCTKTPTYQRMSCVWSTLIGRVLPPQGVTHFCFHVVELS